MVKNKYIDAKSPGFRMPAAWRPWPTRSARANFLSCSSLSGLQPDIDLATASSTTGFISKSRLKYEGLGLGLVYYR